MFFEILDKSLAARIGRLYTKDGYIETPSLFPVVKTEYDPDIINHIRRLGGRNIITNAYLLWKKTKGEKIKIHDYFNFKGVIMTDSGGYQVLKYGDVEIKPKTSLIYQLEIGSDIGVILDYPTGLTRDLEQAKKSVTLTLRRARYARKIVSDSDMILVAPIQGGTFLDLLEKCAKKMKDMGYEMFAIGSPTGLMERYMYKEVLKMILTVKKVLGNAKPIHLFGAGHPMFFPFIVALGIDTFDSAAYSLYARDGRYMTRTRTYKIEEMSYLPCNCEVCRRLDLAEFKTLEEKVRISLIEKHNLYVSLEEMKHIKLHIKEGTLWNYLEEKARAHPSLYEALNFLKENIDFLENYNPFSKINISGVFFFDPYSAISPEVLSYHKRLSMNYKIEKNSIVIFLPFLDEKPFSRSKITSYLKDIVSLKKEILNRLYIIFVGYPFILIPLELAEVFPASQWEGTLNDFPIKEKIDEILDSVLSELEKAIIFVVEDQKELFDKIEDKLREKSSKILRIKIEKNLFYSINNNKSKIIDFLSAHI